MKGRRSSLSSPGTWSREGLRDLPWIPATVLLALAVSVLCVYWQAGNHAFINFDDDTYLYENSIVLRGLTLEEIRWAFTTFHASNWHPLTWLSHMLDVEVFGLWAGGHHAVSVLLHAGNAALLFLILRRMTGSTWRSAFAAALFGVHPLHVESVAWISERKDVLSGLFFFLCLWGYSRYAARPGASRYLWVVLFFVLGLWSKPMVVTLPFVLLLLDFWPLGRFRSGRAARLALEKVPLLVLSAGSCAVTYLAQRSGEAVASLETFPLGARISNAAVSCVSYLWKAVWPSGLSVFYPHPGSVGRSWPWWAVAGSALFLVCVTLVSLRRRRDRPYLGTGWFWYLGTLVPVLGIIQVGSHAYADRYTYVPLIGIFIALAWGVPEVLPGRRHRGIVLGAMAVASLAALTVAARVQTRYWRDSGTLFSHALAVSDRNWLAWNNLGGYYSDTGQTGKAILCYREALRVKPDDAKPWYNLGKEYHRLGEVRQAVECYMTSLRIRPDFAEAWNSLGVSYGSTGQHRQAADCFREALRFRPDFPAAGKNLAAATARLGM